MERLRARLAVADRAVATFEELVGAPFPDRVVRDAATQRFEYSFEAVWRAVQRFFAVVEGVSEGAPKAVVRASFRAGILAENDAEGLLALVDDRNLTVHTYNEALADELAKRVGGHARLLRGWLAAVQKQMPSAKKGQ